jgi:hypothetical protein
LPSSPRLTSPASVVLAVGASHWTCRSPLNKVRVVQSRPVRVFRGLASELPAVWSSVTGGGALERLYRLAGHVPLRLRDVHRLVDRRLA